MDPLLALLPPEWRPHAPVAAGVAAVLALLVTLGIILPSGSLGSSDGGNTPNPPVTTTSAEPTTSAPGTTTAPTSTTVPDPTTTVPTTTPPSSDQPMTFSLRFCEGTGDTYGTTQVRVRGKAVYPGVNILQVMINSVLGEYPRFTGTLDHTYADWAVGTVDVTKPVTIDYVIYNSDRSQNSEFSVTLQPDEIEHGCNA